jgi:hypothetical protein
VAGAGRCGVRAAAATCRRSRRSRASARMSSPRG